MIRDTAGLSPVSPATRPAQPVAPVAPATPAGAGGAAPSVPMLNPRMRIDTELNLVVLEFRDDAGELRSSIPTPREIDAYRLAAQAGEEPSAPDLDVRR
jgi:hypothetical protein